MFDFLGQLEAQYPLRLLGLLLLPVLVYLAIVARVATARARQIASTVCRCLIVALLVFAWAGLVLRGPTGRRYVVVVDDRSASVQGAAATLPDVSNVESERVAVVSFASEPGPVQATRTDSLGDADVLASDPAAAVRAAAGAIPADFVPEIVLATDGHETRGNVFAAARDLGIPIHIAPLPSFSRPEVSLTAVRASLGDQPGGQVHFEITIDSNHEDEGQLALFQIPLDAKAGKSSILQQRVQLAAGQNEVRVSVPHSAADATAFQAVLTDFDDTTDLNNARRAIVFAPPAPRILIVGNDRQSAGNVRSVIAALGYRATAVAPEQLPTSGELENFDLVVLSDVSEQQLGGHRVAAIEAYLEGGGGLIVLGSDATYGSDGYRGSQLESMLPVRAAQDVIPVRSTLAMLLVIDKSESMLKDNRIGLAKQAASQTVDLDLLGPEDKVGILAFGDTSEWVSPIVLCDDKAGLKRRIDTLEAKGRTNMYPALQRAYFALTDAHADRRHIILLTDGVPSPGDFGQLAARMADAGITVSTVSLSAGADQTILKDISRIARGRHIHCETAEELSEKLVEEARSAAEAADRQQYAPFVYRQLPDLDIGGAPPLSGFAATSPKKGAELLLLAGAGDPLLSWWKYGRGTALSFTSVAKKGWAGQWSDWNGYQQFWSRLIRHAIRKHTPPDHYIAVSRRRDAVEVVLDAVRSDGALLNGASPILALQRPTGDDQSGNARATAKSNVPQVAPGRYAETFGAVERGPYLMKLEWTDELGRERTERHGLFVDYPDELQVRPTNEELLRDVALVSGGSYGQDAAQAIARSSGKVERVMPLWRYLALGALLLFVVDVGLRRGLALKG